MKRFLLFVICAFAITVAGCGEKKEDADKEKKSGKEKTTQTSAITDQVVEASCGQCQLGLDGKGCDLAVRIDGKAYYVDGSSIDDHGNAHGDDGMCNCVRKAKVSGEVKDGRFVATSFEVLPAEKNKSDDDK